MRKKLWILLLTVFALALLPGCYGFDSDDFYSLPQRSKDYRAMQTAVESAMQGGSFSAPVSGANRQAIQQADLDGDGQEEILAFCKMDTVRPLNVLIFRRTEEDYHLICALQGDGTSFDSVQYAQIDGAPGMEILLSRRIGEQVQQFVSIYTLKNDAAAELMSAGCAAYTTADLDADQLTDIFLLRSNAEGPRAFAELYCFQDGELRKEAEAGLSTAADAVKRILTGNVSRNTPAVFVASAYDEGHLITDIFALEDGRFSNISQNYESGQSAQTVRNYYVYSTDIDNDGVIEMPTTIALAPVEGDPSSEGQYRIVWYNLSVHGERTEKLTTYHSFAEGWFFYLPEAWCETLSVNKVLFDDGIFGTRFSSLQADGAYRPLMTVFAFSGRNAQKLAQSDGRFLLAQRGDVYYAALPGEGIELTRDEIIARFSFISIDLLPEEGQN